MLAVSASAFTPVGLGFVRVYEYDLNTDMWSPVGPDLPASQEGDHFGVSCSLSSDGDTLAVGARAKDSSGGTSAGHVKVYLRINNVFEPHGAAIDGPSSSAEFGTAVSVNGDGTRLVIGAPSAGPDGQASVYELSAGPAWSRVGNVIDARLFESVFGAAVAISRDGSTVALGAPFSLDGRGAATVVRLDDGEWRRVARRVRGEDIDDLFGTSVSLSADGNTLVVGIYMILLQIVAIVDYFIFFVLFLICFSFLKKSF